ncbi:hypothetical protein K461DRAFT_321759 [Myriangium duriaei CBS 260.36]|uniref:Rhodopsin domain-containing protein n=1 Tax=Myriangium duriaei CBS 260.36 TaxID=1168546 RepID=A0A9P4MFU3_9PEZI|nr:hypothetical protein K461DRAFT_321759 [Myriangium duriaei CBS 260.36]
MAFVIECILDTISWELGDTPMSDLVSAIDASIYFVAEALVRLAYAVFYLGVIPAELDLVWHRRVIVLSVCLHTALQTAFALLYLFQCGSPTKLLNVDANCLNAQTLNLIFVISYYADALLDWLMALMPITVVLKNEMNRRTKLTVAFILLLGCLAGTIAVVEIALSQGAGWLFNTDGSSNHDIILDILNTIETQLAILCLTLAALRPLFRRFLDDTTRKAGRPIKMRAQNDPEDMHLNASETCYDGAQSLYVSMAKI